MEEDNEKKSGQASTEKKDKRAILSKALPVLVVGLVGLVFVPWENLGGESPSEFLLFLGRFHPMVLHMPIGFLFAVFILEVIGFFKRKMALDQAAYLLLWVSVLSAWTAAFLGVFLSMGGGYNDHLMFMHRATGLGVAVLSLWALILKIKIHRQGKKLLAMPYRVVLLVAVGLLGAAGHHGGSLTHGSDYLFKYMPGWLKVVIGKETKDAPEGKPDQEEDPEIFTHLVMPVIEAKCINCHNDEKQKADLNLASFEAMMKGGEDGDVLIPGQPDKSPLFTTTTFDLDDDEHMPPEGKPQLTEDEQELIRWWIEMGAGEKTRLSEVEVSEEMTEVLTRLDPDAQLAEWRDAAAQTLADHEDLVKEMVETLEVGLAPITEGQPELQFACGKAVETFGDDQFAKLRPLAGLLVRVDLKESRVGDDGLSLLKKSERLERLNLQKTGIGDAGLKNLKYLKALKVLNLMGTKITDEGLSQLALLKKLEKLHLWNTAVTLEGALRLQDKLPDTVIGMGGEADRRLAAHRKWKKSGSAGPAQLKEGLIFHAPFDETPVDLIDADNEGTIETSALSYGPGRVGQAVKLEEGAHVVFAGELGLKRTRPFSFSVWFKSQSGTGTICSVVKNEEAQKGFDISLRDGRIGVGLFRAKPDNGIQVLGLRPVGQGVWHHLAVVYNGTGRASGFQLFLDGYPERMEAVQNNLSGDIESNAALIIGHGPEGTSFNGGLDEVRFYSRALSSEEVGMLAVGP